MLIHSAKRGSEQEMTTPVGYNPMPEYLSLNPGPFGSADVLTGPTGEEVYHLHLKNAELSRNVITVGDPGRATSIAERIFLKGIVDELCKNLDDVVETNIEHRGLRTITGTLKVSGIAGQGAGERITIVTSGMGVGSMEIVANELMLLREIDFSTRTRKESFEPLNVVRIGTCGALPEDLVLGSPVIAGYCIAMHNGPAMIEIPAPNGYALELERRLERKVLDVMDPESRHYGRIHPIVTKSDPDLVAALLREAHALDIEVKVGIVAENAGFNAAQARDVLRAAPSIPDLDRHLASFDTGIGDLGILAMEMEGATLTGLLNPHGYRASMVVVPVAQRALDHGITAEAFQSGMENATKLVVNALIRPELRKEPRPYRPADQELPFNEAIGQYVIDQGYKIPAIVTEKALRIAAENAAYSHSPYVGSITPRGAALICELNGRYEIVGGTDFQSAAYGSSTDAVSSAVRAARMTGADIKAVLLYSDSEEKPVMFGKEADVLGTFADEIPVFSIPRNGQPSCSTFRSTNTKLMESFKAYELPERLKNQEPEDRDALLLGATSTDLQKVYGFINPSISFETFKDGIAAAVKGANRSLPLFSGYPVGAALLTIDGTSVMGGNVESLPLSNGQCGERTALEIAGSKGLFSFPENKFSEQLDLIVVYVPQLIPAEPCGGCRQGLTEVTSDKPIVAICRTGEVVYAEGLTSGKVYKLNTDSGELIVEEVLEGGLLRASFGAKNLS